MQSIISDRNPRDLNLRDRADELLAEQYEAVNRRTDHLFGWLLLIEWVAAVCVALWIAPLAWDETGVHQAPYALYTLIAGIIVTGGPLFLIWAMPGSQLTRHAIAVAQMTWSAILIHLTGGRIETHFHVFGSLAILACYRDWRVLLTATFVVAADLALRGIYWPQSVYGVAHDQPFRFLEHLGWVLFEATFLFVAIRQSAREMAAVAFAQARLERSNRRIESECRERTGRYREYAEQLERARHALEQQTCDLQSARATADAANSAKSHFVATVSHEIRTPMTAILGYADILLSSLDDTLCLKAAATIKHSGEYLLKIVDDVLDLSRIEAGKLSIESIPCSPRLVAQEVLHLMHVRSTAKGLKLSLHCEPTTPDEILSDPTRLRQILLNLVSNAIKFSTHGEIRIHLSGEHTSEGEPLLCCQVSDEGIGLSDEQAVRLFQPYSQAQASTARLFGGTGLGLTISRRLAELLGGTIQVASSLGAGSTFTLTIMAPTPHAEGVMKDDRPTMQAPLISSQPTDKKNLATNQKGDQKGEHSQRPPQKKKPAARAVSRSLAGKRILLADDNPASRDQLSAALRARGARLHLVEEGAAVVDWTMKAVASGKPFDLVLIDLHMPGIDGFAATEQLRARGYLRPILALTPHGMPQDPERSLVAGCNACLLKPLDGAALKLIEHYARPSTMKMETSKPAYFAPAEG